MRYMRTQYSIPRSAPILIAGDVTSKFTRRSRRRYYNIARYIHEVVKNRHGNYMVFFPVLFLYGAYL